MNKNQNVVWNGLGTFSITIDTAGQIFVAGQLSLPTITNGGGASAVVVTVNQNGSPKYVGAAGASGFKVDLLTAVNDVIAIVLTGGVNDTHFAVKSHFQIAQGV